MDLATIVAIVSIVVALGTIASHIHKHGLEQLLKKIGVIFLVGTIGWFFIIYGLFPGLRSTWAKVPSRRLLLSCRSFCYNSIL